MKMSEAEAIDVVSGAVNETESGSDDEEILKKNRIKMSVWLYSKFKIAISGVVVSIKDGLPYLRIEYENRRGNQKKAFVSLKKWEERIANLISGAETVDFEKLKKDEEK